MDKNRQLELVLNQCSSFNLKKLKMDTLLLIVHNLLQTYERVDYDKINNPNELTINKAEIEQINKSVFELKNYLENNIIIGETLSYLFKNQNNSKPFLQISKNLEPMRVYYKYLTTLFSTKLQKGSHWIPELLAFSLLYAYKKEYGKSVTSYSFIDNFPIETVLNIYNKNNINIKKNIIKEENKSIWQIKTNLDEMYDLSEFMVKKYLEFNYKINEKRVSKSRVKKRR